MSPQWPRSSLPAELSRAVDELWPLWSALEIPAGTLGVILGSGLGAAAESFPHVWEKKFEDLGLPVATVAGHRGRLILAEGPGADFLFLQGRLHRYEGLPDARVLLPATAMARLGLEAILITNAAGGMDPAFRAGDFMLIRDILSFQWDDPLRGHSPLDSPRLPARRPLFDAVLSAELLAAAAEAAVTVHQGLLTVATGPAYETPAEVRMARRAGAQAASMSTFPESMLLARLGTRCLGLSCITNEIKEMDQEPLNHEEVVAMGRQVAGDFTRLLAAWSLRMESARS